jgi:signal transduction histidine kinase
VSPVFAPIDPIASDPHEVDRLRAARDVRLNTLEIPRLRVLGFTFVALGIGLHEWVVLPVAGLHGWLISALVLEAYSFLSWAALHAAYVRLRPFDLGLAFLAADLLVLDYAIYVTGGDRSLIFFILCCRVADQSHTSVRRSLVFAHLVPLAYIALLAWLALVEGRTLAPLAETVKLVSLYGVSLYMAITATIAEHRRQRASEAVQLSRRVIQQLRDQSAHLDEARRRAEAAAEAKGQFLAAMSHELRTPLNAIIGFSQILLARRDGPLTDVQATFLRNIFGSGRHLLGLVNDVLEMARVEAGRLKLDRSEFDAAAALDEIVATAEPLAREKSLDVTLRCEQRPVTITADAVKFRQMVFNLLSNAIKFTPELGHVSVRLVPAGDVVRVVVSDTGIGVRPEDHQRIFEAFEQVDSTHARAQTGTGLGLALTKQFAELHGGRVWIESEGLAGQGSVFTLELPVLPA